MRSVILIGCLATDVEVKEVGEDSKVSSFILAVDRYAEEADFALQRHAFRPRPDGPLITRVYTLTHSHFTGDLILTVRPRRLPRPY